MFRACIALVALVLGKVVYLHIVHDDQLRAEGRSQRTSETVLRASRGTIYDRDGVEMAISVPATTLFADPSLMTDRAGVAAQLGLALGLTAERQAALLTAFEEPGRQFVYIARQIDDDLAASVMALQLPGVSSIREDRRIIPNGDVGRSVLGRTDPDGVGTGGLELLYNDLLTGEDGERTREKDVDGRSIPGSGTTTRPAIPGDDVVLTLDRSLQYQVEQALLERVNELGADGGSVIVMDTATGEIYAIANVQRGDDGVAAVTSSNLAAVEANEPGSVAKVFSIAAAIDQGIVSADTTLTVPGKLQLREEDAKPIEDAFPHPEMPMTVEDIMVESSNIGTLLIARELGNDQLDAYLRGFGIGQPTGLGFPNESNGFLDQPEELDGSEHDTISYGYGFSTTSLQLVAAVNTVANGGEYVAPRLVSHTINADGEMVAVDAPPSRRVISEATAATMTDMMVDVVCEGTATKAQMDDITVAGKTGTSRKLQENGTYIAEDGSKAYYASFVGFFPANDPKVTILVSIDQPSPEFREFYGGTAAAPLFTKVAEAAIHELQIVPTPGDQGCVQ